MGCKFQQKYSIFCYILKAYHFDKYFRSRHLILKIFSLLGQHNYTVLIQYFTTFQHNYTVLVQHFTTFQHNYTVLIYYFTTLQHNYTVLIQHYITLHHNYTVDSKDLQFTWAAQLCIRYSSSILLLYSTTIWHSSSI